MGRPEMNDGVTEIDPLTTGAAYAMEIAEVERYILVTIIGTGSEGFQGGIVKKANLSPTLDIWPLLRNEIFRQGPDRSGTGTVIPTGPFHTMTERIPLRLKKGDQDGNVVGGCAKTLMMPEANLKGQKDAKQETSPWFLVRHGIPRLRSALLPDRADRGPICLRFDGPDWPTGKCTGRR